MHSIISWYCRRKLKQKSIMYGAYLDVAAYNNPSWDVARRSSEDFLHTETLAWLTTDGLFAEPLLPGNQNALTGNFHNSTACNSCNYELINNELTTLEDFILICEVSELEGPKPLVSIPHYAENNFCVDTNTLAEKLMSIDYFYSNRELFDNSQDTQVILSSITEDFHAFANYFNLYDISARGFIRPICIAYVTTNKRKLLEFFDCLRNHFLYVSKCLKHGNRKLFLQDLHLYLQDLQKAKDDFVTNCITPNDVLNEGFKLYDGNRESAVINQFADNIIEIQHILSTKKPILDDSDIADLFFKTEVQVKTQFYNELFKQAQHFVQTEPTHSTKLDSLDCNAQCSQLRSVFQLCSWGIVIGFNELMSLQKYFKRDFPTVYIDTEEIKLLSPSESLITYGNYIITNTKTVYGDDQKLNFSSDNIIDPLKKNLSEIQAIFSAMETNSSVINDHRRCSFLELERDEDFDDSESYDSFCESCSISTSNTTEVQVSALLKRNNLLQSDQEIGATLSESFESYCSVLESPQEFLTETELSNDSTANIYISLAKHVHFLSPDKPGYGIANVFAQIQNFPDIFFSLLIGNQVIITGNSDEEELVRSVVQAFDILVPDKRNAPIAFPWCTNGIKADEIDRYKLIGLCIPDTNMDDNVFVPEDYESPVSIVYVGKNKYLGPIYSGEFLESLSQINRSDWEDSAFLCYLHSRILSITTRLHLFRNRISEKNLKNKEKSDALKKNENSIITELQIRKDDAAIIKYLASIF